MRTAGGVHCKETPPSKLLQSLRPLRSSWGKSLGTLREHVASTTLCQGALLLTLLWSLCACVGVAEPTATTTQPRHPHIPETFSFWTDRCIGNNRGHQASCVSAHCQQERAENFLSTGHHQRRIQRPQPLSWRLSTREPSQGNGVPCWEPTSAWLGRVLPSALVVAKRLPSANQSRPSVCWTSGPPCSACAGQSPSFFAAINLPPCGKGRPECNDRWPNLIGATGSGQTTQLVEPSRATGTIPHRRGECLSSPQPDSPERPGARPREEVSVSWHSGTTPQPRSTCLLRASWD